MCWRARLTRFLVWIAVLAWGTLLGAKLFDLVVLAGAWNRSPPESLHLLPYGPNFPVDTGEFFIPSSAALLVSTFAALASGWTSPWNYRALLVVQAVAIFSTLVLTVTVFWPMNAALWAYASAKLGAPSAAEAVRLAHTWVALDWARVAAGAIGFLCATRLLSMPYPEARAQADPPAVTIALVLSLLAVGAFLAYFASNI